MPRSKLKPSNHHPMLAKEYRAVIAALGLSQVAAADMLDIGPRTSRRFALGEQPVWPLAACLLRLMLACRVSPEQLRKLNQKGATLHRIDP